MTGRPWPRGLAGFVAGAAAVLKGARRVLTDPEMRAASLVPWLLTGLIYVLALAGLSFGSGPLLEGLWAQPEAIGWLILWWLVRMVVVLVLFAVLLVLFSVVAEAVAGPFLERMMIKELARWGVEVTPSSFWQGTVLELFRALGLAILALVLLAASWVPTVGPAFTVLGTVCAWYAFGSGAWSAVLVLEGRSFRDRMGWIWEHRMVVLGLGAVSSLAMMVPLLGWLVLPASHVGATEMFARLAGERESAVAGPPES